MTIRFGSRVLVLVLALSLFSAPRARADVTLGDSALTVAVSTLAGAVLGASTLPFYENSGDHTNNIFYGAAIGAVVGVFVAAYAGVQEGPDYDTRFAPKTPSALALNEAPSLRLVSETSSATRKPASFSAGSTLAWSPVATFHF